MVALGVVDPDRVVEGEAWVPVARLLLSQPPRQRVFSSTQQARLAC
jgi:hypothetical protein